MNVFVKAAIGFTVAAVGIYVAVTSYNMEKEEQKLKAELDSLFTLLCEMGPELPINFGAYSINAIKEAYLITLSSDSPYHWANEQLLDELYTRDNK